MDTSTTPLPANGEEIGRDKDDRTRIQIGSRGGSFDGRSGLQVTISGLDTRELEHMEGMTHGHQWITVSDRGRLRSIATYKELPEPDADEMMVPFWRPAILGIETQMEMFDIEPKDAGLMPSIIIQHLCGYQYSREGYALQAKILQTFGFECLRSRRGASGKFHEMWLLSSLYSAQGRLKVMIDEVARKPNESSYDHRRLEATIRFLCRSVQFGSMDVTRQCAAMTID